MTLSKASNSLFSDYLFFSSIEFFNETFLVLKTSNFNLSENVYRICIFYLKKPEKVIKKVQVYRKNGIQSP